MIEGFLAVTSQPSSRLPIDEFHEWYDGEHIPLRLNHLKEFLSGARYKACTRGSEEDDDDDDDSTSSSLWLALYALTSSAVLYSKPYTDLRTNRSERESDVMSRIEELTRLMGDVVGVWCHDDSEVVKRTTGFFMHGRPPAEWIVSHRLRINDDRRRDHDGTTAVGTDPDDYSKEIINSWASHLRAKQQCDKEVCFSAGWVRTLLIHVLEFGISRFGVESAKAIDTPTVMPSYYVVHEFTNKKAVESCMRFILDVPYPGIDLGERTLWRLYKAYPCLSQQLSEPEVDGIATE